MSYGLYISAEGAEAQQYRMESIANNIANLETPGFKRELALQMARATERQDLGDDFYGSGSYNDLSGGVLTIGTHTEFKQGPIKETGNWADLAIEGNAWFRVRDKSTGEEFLTRAGNFAVFNDAEDGTASLVTEQGRSRFELLNPDGLPVIIPNPNDPTLHITDDGRIMGDDGPLWGIGIGEVARISLVEPDDLKAMVKVGETMYRNESGQRELEQFERRQLLPEHLEMSGTNPSTEMIEMIVTQRCLEGNVKMIHVQDEATGGLVSRVLRV